MLAMLMANTLYSYSKDCDAGVTLYDTAQFTFYLLPRMVGTTRAIRISAKRYQGMQARIR